MKQHRSDNRGFTGLEAAIVLIAFVVVAAVFTYVLFGVKTLDPNLPVTGVPRPAVSPIEVVGNVYGFGTGIPGAMEINRIQLNVGLAHEAPPIDLTKVIILVSQPDVATITHLKYANSSGPSTFTVEELGTHRELTNLQGEAQGTVVIALPANLLSNDTITIELIPAGSPALSLTRSTDATIYSTQVLR